MKNIKLTVSAHITARPRRQTQYGSHSLPGMCALNKDRQAGMQTDRQTDIQMRFKAFARQSQCAVVNRVLLFDVFYLSFLCETEALLIKHLKLLFKKINSIYRTVFFNRLCAETLAEGLWLPSLMLFVFKG